MSMKKWFLIFSFLLLLVQTNAQSSFFHNSDTINKPRVIATTSAIATAWVAGTTAVYGAWYSKDSISKFHFFNDSHEWLQMDKIGHLHTANKLTGLTYGFYRWSGVSRRKAIILGSSIGLAYQTTLEIMDGKSSTWGFSWSDMAANTLGVLSFASQEFVWNEQRFLFKFSYHTTPYASIRPSVLGASNSERFLKDYNGQTYWMSFSPSTFFNLASYPKWLCFSLGYGVDQKLVGSKEFYIDPLTHVMYQSHREWVLSLDIDFSKLPIRKEWLRKIVKQLNYVKVPLPALMFSNHKIRGYGIYF